MDYFRVKYRSLLLVYLLLGLHQVRGMDNNAGPVTVDFQDFFKLGNHDVPDWQKIYRVYEGASRDTILAARSQVAGEGLGDTVLHAAIRWSNLYLINQFIGLKSLVNEVNGAGDTPLDLSFKYELEFELTARLLQAGSKVTPHTIHCCLQQNPHKLELLLEDKKRFDTTLAQCLNKPGWLLREAARYGRLIGMEYILDKEGDTNINVPDEESGCTPLYFAVCAGETGCVYKLLRYGADMSIANKHGFIPLQAAQQGLKSGVRPDYLPEIMGVEEYYGSIITALTDQMRRQEEEEAEKQKNDPSIDDQLSSSSSTCTSSKNKSTLTTIYSVRYPILIVAGIASVAAVACIYWKKHQKNKKAELNTQGEADGDICA